jgi:hypothetical protein
MSTPPPPGPSRAGAAAAPGSGRSPDCDLYVDAEHPDRIRQDLAGHLQAAGDGRTLHLPGAEVWVGRNKRHMDTGPDPEFVDWPTLIELYPSTTQPAGPAAAGSTTAAAGQPDAASLPAKVDLVPLITAVMERLRRRGNRVVAACDFEGRLPRWDRMREPQIEDEDLDDGYDTGDDRLLYQGRLFTGTTVYHRPDGGRQETEASYGLRDGLDRVYRADGTLWRENWYDTGTLVRGRRWHPGDQLEYDARLHQDGPQLAVRRWTADGQPVRRRWWARRGGQPELVTTDALR